MDGLGARRIRANLRIERDNAALYARLAQLAENPRLARAYRRIAEIEHTNARFWEVRLRDVGEAVPPPRVHLRVRALGWLAARLGTAFVMPTVVRLEHADHVESPVDRERQRDHFTVGNAVPARGGRHIVGRGNTLRAAVLGANDGLVSNASLVMGMAGATAGDHAVLLAGLAGLVAGACSMALGEWLSVQTSREFYQAQITERAERLAVAPEDARRYLAQSYRDKGLDGTAAETLANGLIADRRAALDAIVREDLGVDPADLGGSAWSAAISSFCLFAFGALFPVAPYFAATGAHALIASIACTACGLLLIALATSLATGRGIVSSITRQFAITASATTVTYFVGRLLGVAVNG
jgi:VIT1/CCC1 family predicted Fe2+/Mn2+ transporter